MKNQEKKKSKKKILLSYLILAVCLLVIAAVTVSVVFTVNRNSGGGITIDKPDVPDNPGTPDNPDDGKEPDNPVNTATEFILPTSSGSLSKTHEELIHNGAGQFRAHMGVDFAGTAGENVCAVLDGEVTAITENISPNNITEGGVITLTHANGITTTYKYIDTAANLKIGDKINRGTVIGTIAKACGNEESVGDHLHFELMVNGEYADPVTYLDIIEK
ncbi:MAG: M23 family metallopeptidase [Clostridia bacterium]|nr:M23 family metallopeptidase [Clostridia bacterium]